MNDGLRSVVVEACEEFVPEILNPRAGIIIPDKDEELNWHAFLAHSLDQQGFRADWFVGRAPNPEWPDFRTLWKRQIGIPQLASLWDIEAIRRPLSSPRKAGLLRVEDAVRVIERHGGEVGGSLAEAFRTFPRRKNIKTIRAYLQNSHRLAEYGFSFRRYLRHQVNLLVGPDVAFPPTDFMMEVPWREPPVTMEDDLAGCLERDFFMVGPEIARYMLCDWLLGLWVKGDIPWFDLFKWDSRNEQFFRRFGEELTTRGAFLEWCRGQDFPYPPRVVNEAIWLWEEQGASHTQTNGGRRNRPALCS